MNISRFQWYWHRLRAMSPGEIAGHARKKMFQFADARWPGEAGEAKVGQTSGFPKLPDPKAAPQMVREALRRDAENIMAGRWRAFGQIKIQVDDPPKWHCDYLVGKDLATGASAFTLNHRSLPGGADVKLIWELSRWSQLVRLAQAAYVLGDDVPGRKCLHWLGNWVKHNPPYRGWNWTSALEVGMRLIQFAWIDALLSARTETVAFGEELNSLRYKILPPHVRFAWRYKSFGSSANNHLIGELVGLILASVRWPSLQEWGAPIDELQRRWEEEVLAQFAEDGGNKEQALNYQLFSFEFAWQARLALVATGRTVSPAIEERLTRAADFFSKVQTDSDPWDYGDSDCASVTPFFADEQKAAAEWRAWMSSQANGGEAIRFWCGPPPKRIASTGVAPSSSESSLPRGKWVIFSKSGHALFRSSDWNLHWDLSPLGYGSTAAHGHLDALHLSIWHRGMAVVIDPGTGAYYADGKLRTHLASWDAHNGPHPVGPDFPKRLGPFLWSEQHATPRWEQISEKITAAELSLPVGRVRRVIRQNDMADGWQIDDSFEPKEGVICFTVRWQFAPDAVVETLSNRKFLVRRGISSVIVEVAKEWEEAELVVPGENPGDLRGVVSPGFRQISSAPYLQLNARSHKPCIFRTTFLASPTS